MAKFDVLTVSEPQALASGIMQYVQVCSAPRRRSMPTLLWQAHSLQGTNGLCSLMGG